ncbi:MAG: glycosyltransferase family 4 protein [Planctomycetota bacterium]|nr:glycosyltransferase family 4 protein [Planctomycetota bacterium]
MKINYLTAGAGGMYCGSCLHDNTLARALHRLGVDVQLIPTYTPIRTDEEDATIDRVFLGGLNVYLQQKLFLFRYLPGFLDRWLDRPGLIRWMTSRAMETSPRQLGALAVSMLQGSQGRQRKEVHRLCRWMQDQQKPDLLNFSNILIAGCVPSLKSALDVPVVVTLQGDDIFLENLVEPYRGRAQKLIRGLVEHIDGFLVHSDYYAGVMSEYLDIPRDRFHKIPLGVDTSDFQLAAETAAERPSSAPPTVGYLARIAEEKGLHVLVDAFLELRQRPGLEDVRLRIAGWLGPGQRAYADAQFAKLRAAGATNVYDYAGEIDRREKIAFLRSLDLLSVPTTYREPKGLFVLEALAAGVPVVVPDHGAFPELLGQTGGGQLVAPEQPGQLAGVLADLLENRQLRGELAAQGRQRVWEEMNADAMARKTLDVLGRFVS